jgi:hypothetical protein
MALLTEGGLLLHSQDTCLNWRDTRDRHGGELMQTFKLFKSIGLLMLLTITVNAQSDFAHPLDR